MSTRDEGKTHFYGDDCPGGHRAANVAGVDWDDQETADEANAREAAEREQPASPTAGTADVVTDEMVDAYVSAIFTGWYIEMKGEELRQDVRAGLAAVVPLIRAQLAAEHRCVTVVEEGPPEFFIDDHDMAVIGLYEEVESLEPVESSEDQERSEEERR